MARRHLAFAIKANPTDQRLVKQRDKIDIGANFLVAVADNKFSLLGEPDALAGKLRRRDFVHIALLERAGVDRCRRRCVSFRLGNGIVSLLLFLQRHGLPLLLGYNFI
jgi:hypothetical protein